MNNTASANGIKAAELTLPKGGGAIQGIGETFQPNEFTGTAGLSIPVAVTPCRGFEPQISIGYSSGSGDGPFGLGFGLSIPNIARKTAKGTPRYDGTDTFILSNADDLVPIANKTRQQKAGAASFTVIPYYVRTEGLFAKIEQWIDQGNGDTHWQVTSADNITSIYGRNPNARIADPADPAHVFQWLLEESYDARSNRICYHYKAEDTANVAPTIYEINRTQTANRYIERITYGNSTPFDASSADAKVDTPAEESWHFEIVFDYGEYNIDPANRTPYRPVRTWAQRQDPFSSYLGGFEIRTHRLCRNVLLFHRFPQELGAEPVLVSATQLSYDEGRVRTLLTGVTHTGYRLQTGQNAGGYTTRSLPPLHFGYPPFTPEGHEYAQLNQADGRPPAGMERAPHYLLIDLYGEGIPGILYSDGSSTLYAEPTLTAVNDQSADKLNGTLTYARPDAPALFPIERQVQNGSRTLTDVTGNGRVDLVVSSPTGAGYYEANPDRTWRPFQPFASFPTAFHQPDSQLIDVTGDGLADLLTLEEDWVRIYPSQRDQGYGAPLLTPRANGAPTSKAPAPTEVVRFMDLFGTGTQHLVRIRNGSVECWPHLGYGRFGAKVLLANAPHFGAELDASRLLLADVDGSGTVDLVYLHSDHVAIYFNESGNAFSEPIHIPLPSRYDRPDQVSFADLYGRGTDCLLFSEYAPDPRHWCYDFCQGEKPYLLNLVDNNMGAQTKLTYASSTYYYLQDKAAGRPWITQLPFPVHVVAATEHLDLIGETRLVSSFAYHHGYYDGEEREFRGFGLVERRDAESFAAFSQHAPADQGAATTSEWYVPPILTKSWYHTGSWQHAGTIARRYAHEYYQGDPAAHDLPDSTVDFSVLNGAPPDGESWRQAAAALRGHVLRTEVYAQDGSPQEPHPYAVTETSYGVRLLQAKGANADADAVYLVHPSETLSYHYERNPADPRIQHEFVLDVDQYGHVRQRCAVAYPRRAAAGSRYAPEQSTLHATMTLTDLTNVDASADPGQAFHLLGVPWQERHFELGGLPAAKDIYTLAQMRAVVVDALKAIIPYEGALAGNRPQARLLEWTRTYYANDSTPPTIADPATLDRRQALPLGQVSARHLLYRVDQAAFSHAQIDQLFGKSVTTAMLTSTAGDGGGYHATDSARVAGETWPNAYPPNADAHWWRGGLRQLYDPTHFYLPQRTVDPFGAQTAVTYDAYSLAITRLTDPVQNQLLAVTDYQTLTPTQITDMNGTITGVLNDPLGMVIATTIYGAEEGQPAGDRDLAGYQVRTDASLEAILDRLARGQGNYYLQEATSFFYYDLEAWQARRQPLQTLSLLRETHVHDLARGETSRLQAHIAYSDGFGRALQTKVQADPGPAFLRNADGSLQLDGQGQPVTGAAPDRWLVSGRIRYNNKGKPVKQYEPFYSATPRYEAERELAQVGVSPILRYDPLARVIRTEEPRRFALASIARPGVDEASGVYARVDFDAWSESHWGANDTLLDAAYYAAFRRYDAAARSDSKLSASDRRLLDAEKDALDKAARHANTPTIQLLDTLGRPFLVYQTQEGFSANAFFARLQGPAPQADAQGLAAGQPADALLPTHHGLDIEGQELTSTDPRLFQRNLGGGTAHHNFVHTYGLGGDLLQTVSADAGTNLSLNNAVGSFWWNRSARNFEQTITYDALQRKTQIRIKGLKNDGALASDTLVETFTYGESQPNAAARHLRGQLYQHQDQSGVITNDRYNIHGLLLESHRQLTAAYQGYVDWAAPVTVDLTVYTQQASYNALGQPTSATTPDATVTRHHFNRLGQLDQISVQPKGETTPQTIVKGIDYNPRGQRAAIRYGNGVTTTYDYDAATFHLVRLQSQRAAQAAGGATRAPQLQDLAYRYDPVGNITSIYDATYQPIFHNNQVVAPLCTYTYDALYRLVAATGRQHRAITATTYRNADAGDFGQSKLITLPDDGQALENYAEGYRYDTAGNLIETAHRAGHNWTRRLTLAPDSNRVQTIDDGSGSTQPMEYDRSGNQRQLHLGSPVGLTWSCCDTLVKAAFVARPGGVDDSDYYTYDSAEQRTRKVAERLAANGVTQVEEKRYLGNYEEKLRYTVSANGKSVTFKRQTLRILDDQSCVATLHTWVQDDQGREVDRAGTSKLDYHLDNHLGSVALTVTADAALLRYEEYFPYGGTALIAGSSQREVARNAYRYSGKERDDSSGLYYYGARYYAPWLARWLSPDPAGTVDGLNLYGFVGGNPTTEVDTNGRTISKKRRLDSDMVATFQNLQGAGNTPQKKRQTSRGLSKEIFVGAEVNSTYPVPKSNYVLLNSLSSSSTLNKSMNYLVPTGSTLVTNLTPPNDVLNALHQFHAIPQNATTIDGIHGSNSKRTSRRRPVRVNTNKNNKKNNVNLFATHERSNSGQRAQKALAAEFYALIDRHPGEPVALLGDMNKNPATMQNLFDNLSTETGRPKVNVVVPQIPTHSSGNTLDFVITNIETKNISVTADPPSNRGGTGGLSDHGSITARISENPRIEK